MNQIGYHYKHHQHKPTVPTPWKPCDCYYGKSFIV
uniref:Uncharacterized protein n=1 Tax=Anguilla anguilla TaxID=7936 RepID=A0A0E9PY01_ANGAN